jgi:hypothetical protein
MKKQREQLNKREKASLVQHQRKERACIAKHLQQ